MRAAAAVAAVAAAFAATVAWPYALCAQGSADAALRVLVVADPQIEARPVAVDALNVGHWNALANDLYFWHTYRAAVDLVEPHAVLLLGDLLSSQYIPKSEFWIRAKRIQAMFPALPGVPWIALAGNHDVGYGDECNDRRMARFEAAFGKANQVQVIGGVRFVALNTLTMDGTAAASDTHRREAWDLLTELEAEQSASPTVLLTHIPLWKPPGACVDDPTLEVNKAGRVEQQNHLSQNLTQRLLDAFVHPVAVFSGHDHEGCVWRHGNVPEYTVRSIMGGYSGHIGVLEIVDAGTGEHHFWQCGFLHMRLLVGMVVGLVVAGLGLLLRGLIAA